MTVRQSYVGDVSRIYVSGAFEATAGVAQTLTKSWRPQSCGVKQSEDASVDAVVSGYRGGVSQTRERVKAGGPLSCYCQPDFAAWLFKMIFSKSPTSAVVAPSSTVYEHVFDSFEAGVGTFTLMKQIAGISTYTERFRGCAVDSFSLKSGKGKVELSTNIIGFGSLDRGQTEPVVVVPTEAYLTGTPTQLWIDGTQTTPNDLQAAWSLSFSPGYGLIDAAGSLDGAMTRIDFAGEPEVTADLTLVTSDRSWLDAFVGETYHAWEFRCPGPVIDAANSLTSLVAVKIERSRTNGGTPSEIGEKGLYMEKLKLHGLVDTTLGRMISCRVRNLVASY